MSEARDRYKGISRNGKIELEPGATLADGVEVVVLLNQTTTMKPKPRRKRCRAKDLLNSEIFGMWADRPDIEDSADFARDLRLRAWGRAS